MAHHSMNQRVNQLDAFSVLERCHEKRDCAASIDAEEDGGNLEVSIEL